MLNEENRRMAKFEFPQDKILAILDKVAQRDRLYKGFYLLQFENTNPDDGKIFIDRNDSTKEELFKLLTMEKL